MSVTMFVGPSAHSLPAELFTDAGVRRLPPAQRGDVARVAAGLTGPGNIAIVDGRFGDVLAVGHREIRDAVQNGWEVWGLCSMGALRAAEMTACGVRGFGTVYQYVRALEPPDDELALLHGPGPEYRPVTEALVDIAAMLSRLTADGDLTATQSFDVLDALGSTWFGQRSQAEVLRLIQQAGGRPTQATATSWRVADHRVKTSDLRRFLQERPWDRD